MHTLLESSAKTIHQTQALWHTIQAANVLEARQHLHLGALPNLPLNPLGKACIHYAAIKGDTTLLDSLWAAGANLNLQDIQGRTPLQEAATAGRTSAVQWLLERGADLHQVNRKGDSALTLAESRGYLGIVRVIRAFEAHQQRLSRLTPLIRTPPSQKATLAATHALGRTIASWQPNTASPLKTVQKHLREGADLQAMDKEGRSFLHRAAALGHRGLVQYLLDQGAHLHAVDRHFNTALHEAVTHGHLEVVQCLVQALLAAGTNLEPTTLFGKTPLHLAATVDHPQLVQYLLAQGANIHAEDGTGQTALHYAVMQGNGLTLGYLLAAGADKHKQDFHGITPLQKARLQENTTILDCLTQNDPLNAATIVEREVPMLIFSQQIPKKEENLEPAVAKSDDPEPRHESQRSLKKQRIHP